MGREAKVPLQKRCQLGPHTKLQARHGYSKTLLRKSKQVNKKSLKNKKKDLLPSACIGTEKKKKDMTELKLESS